MHTSGLDINTDTKFPLVWEIHFESLPIANGNVIAIDSGRTPARSAGSHATY